VNIQSVQDSTAVDMVPVTIDSSTTKEATPDPVIEKPT
jgi:hypothetical protein